MVSESEFILFRATKQKACWKIYVEIRATHRAAVLAISLPASELEMTPDYQAKLRELTLKQVAPITIIGGKNNTGKTTLLEALFN
jgi:predicted ATPase